MPLEIRYGTQGACPDLPSALRTIAVRARQAGAGGVRLGSRLRTVGLFAHIHCPGLSNIKKGGFPLWGAAENLRLKKQAPSGIGAGRRRARDVRRHHQSARCGCEQRPLEPRIAKGT